MHTVAHETTCGPCMCAADSQSGSRQQNCGSRRHRMAASRRHSPCHCCSASSGRRSRRRQLLARSRRPHDTPVRTRHSLGLPRDGCMFGCRLHCSYTRVPAAKRVSKASSSSAAALAVQQLAQGPPCIGCTLDSALHDSGVGSIARSDHGADAANDTDGTQPSARRAPGTQPGNATSDTVSFQCRHPPAVGAVWVNV